MKKEIIFSFDDWLLETEYFAKYSNTYRDWTQKNIFERNRNFDWQSYIECRKKIKWFFVGCTLYGKNYGPWTRHEKLLELFDLPRINDRENFNLKYNEITDTRCRSLLEKHKNQQWIVYWSGGTDSTVILASLIKNTKPADRENIVVACNRDSVFEYPSFYFDHVKPNFKVIDLSAAMQNYLTTTNKNNFIIVEGNLGDQINGNKEYLNLTKEGLYELDVHKNIDVVCEFYSKKYNISKKASMWWYNFWMSSIKSADVPVKTVGQFAGWIWYERQAPVKMRSMSQSGLNLKEFESNYVIWYDCPKYRSWAISKHLNDSSKQDVWSFKVDAKKYIFDLTKDEWYFNFKQKGYMNAFVSPYKRIEDFTAITSDGSRLHETQNLEELLTLLPKYVNLF